MPDRDMAIRNLATGDIFHADGANRASLICLVTSVTETTVQARTLTTQLCLSFNRQTGTAAWDSGTIDSTAPLPVAVADALLGLDRRYRLGTDPDRARLLDAEKRALSFVYHFYRENRLD